LECRKNIGPESRGVPVKKSKRARKPQMGGREKRGRTKNVSQIFINASTKDSENRGFEKGSQAKKLFQGSEGSGGPERWKKKTKSIKERGGYGWPAGSNKVRIDLG